jgi:hypothetical protein
MSDDAAPGDDGGVERLAARLHGLAQGLGVDPATVRQIAARVIADMPQHTDEERMGRARNWMLVASA